MSTTKRKRTTKKTSAVTQSLFNRTVSCVNDLVDDFSHSVLNLDN